MTIDTKSLRAVCDAAITFARPSFLHTFDPPTVTAMLDEIDQLKARTEEAEQENQLLREQVATLLHKYESKCACGQRKPEMYKECEHCYMTAFTESLDKKEPT